MTDAPNMKLCIDCGPRAENQFRRRKAGRLNSRCRRCTRKAAALEKAQR